MFRPQIQKTGILFSLAVFCLIMVYIALNSVEIEEAIGYQDKMKAVEIMEDCLSILKKVVNKEHILPDHDPNYTGLIFDDKYSPMITYSGDKPTLDSKQTVLKTIFASLIVDLFLKVDLTKGDTIAVGMTGSFPGANIALLSACEAMEIVPVIISSIGASEWGATDPNFTWLDLEKILVDSAVVSYRSKAVSLGGYRDMYGLNPNNGYGGPEAKKLAEKAIARNEDIERIVEKKSKRVSDRKDIYKKYIHGQLLANYSAFVNIGGGVGSIGIEGKKNYKWGILDAKKVAPDARHFNNSGIIKEFAKKNVQLINIQQIDELIKDDDGRELIKYGVNLKDPDVPGTGPLFSSERYTVKTLLVTLLALISTLGIVVAIGINSFHQINKHMNTYETDSIL